MVKEVNKIEITLEKPDIDFFKAIISKIDQRELQAGFVRDDIAINIHLNSFELAFIKKLNSKLNKDEKKED